MLTHTYRLVICDLLATMAAEMLLLLLARCCQQQQPHVAPAPGERMRPPKPCERRATCSPNTLTRRARHLPRRPPPPPPPQSSATTRQPLMVRVSHLLCRRVTRVARSQLHRRVHARARKINKFALWPGVRQVGARLAVAVSDNSHATRVRASKLTTPAKTTITNE